MSVVIKGTLICAPLFGRGSEKRGNPKRGGKLKLSLDFAKVSS